MEHAAYGILVWACWGRAFSINRDRNVHSRSLDCSVMVNGPRFYLGAVCTEPFHHPTNDHLDWMILASEPCAVLPAHTPLAAFVFFMNRERETTL